MEHEVNEDKTQVICFSHPPKPVEVLLRMNGRDVTFLNHDKGLHGECI